MDEKDNGQSRAGHMIMNMLLRRLLHCHKAEIILLSTRYSFIGKVKVSKDIACSSDMSNSSVLFQLY
jgi:hypothetical protein